MTPEQRVAEALGCHVETDATDLRDWCDDPDHDACPRTWAAALNAVRDALASDDPAVVRAMAERVGLLTEERATPTTVDAGDGAACLSEACVWWPEPHGHVRVTHRRRVEPWREVPNAIA